MPTLFGGSSFKYMSFIYDPGIYSFFSTHDMRAVSSLHSLLEHLLSSYDHECFHDFKTSSQAPPAQALPSPSIKI